LIKPEFPGDYTPFSQGDIYSLPLPIENEPDAIKQTLWRATDQAYKSALSSYTALKNRKENEKQILGPDDFSREPIENYYEDPYDEEDITFQREEWIERLKEYSGISGTDTTIFQCEASFNIIFSGNILFLRKVALWLKILPLVRCNFWPEFSMKKNTASLAEILYLFFP
jgi:hypothetical protein